MRHRNSAGVGLGFALLSGITFGFSGTFARSLIDAGWSAGAAVLVRVGLAAAILAVPALLALRGRGALVRRNLSAIGIFGLVAIAGTQVCFFNAVRHLPVGVAILLEYLGIMLVVGWMWLVHGERPRRLTVVGAVAAAIGLIFVLNLTGNTQLDPVGVLWGLGAAIGMAAYFVLSARGDHDLPPVVLASGAMAVGAVVLAGLGVIGLLPLEATFDTVNLGDQQLSWVVPVVGLSLVATVIAYVAGIGGARLLGARLASFVGLTEVLFAILIAWLVLGELPTVSQLVGGVLIVAGVALVRIDELRPGREPTPDVGSIAAGSYARLNDGSTNAEPPAQRVPTDKVTV